MSGGFPNHPMFPLGNNIEEADFLTDTGDSFLHETEEEEAEWDASTLSLNTHTPQRIEFAYEAAANGAYPGYTPLRKSSTSAKMEPARPLVANGDVFLDSFETPPEFKRHKPRFETSAIDNRARTPYYQSNVNDDASDDKSVESNNWASSFSYGPAKYLNSAPSPMTGGIQVQQPNISTPLQSPANRSISSFQSTSTMDTQRLSRLSHRSSTSLSLLFGEVINLEADPHMLVSKSCSPLSRYHHRGGMLDIDLESQGPMPLEGLEIGGGLRPPSGFQQLLSNATDLRDNAIQAMEGPMEVVTNGVKQVKHIGRTTTRGFQFVVSKTRTATEKIIHSYRPPLSPHAQALEDLDYLQQKHRLKVCQLKENSELDEHYDFVLILKPQEAYRYWAEILDFRVEHLGEEYLAAMDPVVETASTNSTDSVASDDEAAPLRANIEFTTPRTGMRRRARTPGSCDSSKSPSSSSVLHDLPPRPSLTSIYSSPDPKNISLASSKRVTHRLSMFEKAVGVQRSPMPGVVGASFANDRTPIHEKSQHVASTVRRRWGNHNHSFQNQSAATLNLLSPPVKSLTRGSTSVRKITANQVPSKAQESDNSATEAKENVNPNQIRSEEDIPNQVIPRGIAARTNGMLPFLSALKRGFVVRRHRANKNAIYCKIYSNDGGDTIQYQLIDTEEAMMFFKEQRIRHNRKLTQASSPEAMRKIARDWACIDSKGKDNGSQIHKFNVPDHVAAHRYRERFFKERGLKKTMLDIATKAANSGIIRASEVVAVHPASHLDPREPGLRHGDSGTASLRKSNSAYHTPNTFSIVINTGQRFASQKGKKPTFRRADATENKWYSGEGNDLQFKVLDFEAASEGEYWLIFRGFLLLHRDVAVGRFAADRRAGIGGGNHNPRDNDGRSDDTPVYELENMLHRDEFLEPVTVGCLERAVVNLRKLDTTYMEGAISQTAIPPPSDYFLGFKSPGTQVWSRLRLAGLETTRIYAVDSKRVMIKVRCPEDRLTDVAEVLRVKMKTLDGSYAAFREDTADMFRPLNDIHDVPSLYEGQVASLLRSKDRQSIIDFIIGSRIRDSGAELGPTTDLGKTVMARVPLHMHSKLETLFRPWVYYWRVENWTGRRAPVDKNTSFAASTPHGIGSSPSTPKTMDRSMEDDVPNFFTRFVVGAFHQPLDAIEEYFGEQVTFYFAWLQHCARHLLVLTVIGLLVAICQLASGTSDHPIRPYFAMVVMVWTFMVLINWRKRSNLLAYKWGSMDHKDKETPRPEFHGEYVVDEITKEWVMTYPHWKRYLKYLISVPISCAFTGMAVMLILLVHYNRDLQMENYVRSIDDPMAEPFKFELSLKNIGQEVKVTEVQLTRQLLLDPTFWVVMGALPAMLGLSIPIMNLILMKISVMLNNFENYRTESEYRTHLIIKVFSFRFVSQFGTLYYYAAISLGDETTIQNGMIRMGTSVMIYTTVAHWWTIFLQVYFFMFIRNTRKFFYRRKLRTELKNIELEEEAVASNDFSDAEAQQIRIINKRMLLDQAQDDIWFEVMNPPHDSFPEYITAVVQFSFVACFSVVLPITPFLVLFNYLLSMRYDAYKLCRGRRRPLAKKTGGIGIWEHLLHIVAVIAVLTNCWLIAFTSKDFLWIAERIGQLGLFALVVFWEHMMLLIKYVMQTTISPLPRVVRDEKKREQHRLDKERYTTLRTKNLDRRSKIERAHEHNTPPPRAQNPVVEVEKSVPTTGQTHSPLPTKRKLETIPSFESPSDIETMASF